MKKTRATLLLGASAALTAGLLTASIAPASATDSCNFEVLSLTAWELQDGNGQDEIKFKLGDDTYGQFTFTDNWTRNDSLGHPDEDFNGIVGFELWDVDGAFKSAIDTDFVGCVAGDHTLDLDGGGAIYDLRYRITP